ncbi:unnamed protein product, partial [Prorocentrum cordatum]
VLVDGKGEPCYCLAEVAPADGRLAAADAARPAREEPSAGDLDPQHAAALLRTMAAALRGDPKGYMSGNELRKLLDERHPEVVKEAKACLKGKGWLRKILESDGRIYTVEVQTVGEPCYTLNANFSGGTLLSPSSAAVCQPRTGAPANLAKLDEIQKATLQAAAASALDVAEEGFLPGSTLSKLMAEAHPDVVSAVKSALGGKGWLRKLLCDQPELDVVEVSAPGHGEPCYAIRDRWDSRPVREGGPPSREQRPGTDLQRELPPFRRDPNMAAMSWPRLRGAGGPR